MTKETETNLQKKKEKDLGQSLTVRYQLDLTGGHFQPYLSGLPDSECPGLD
jgi:hypothetical protein